jgi:hypothetical protein
MPCLGQLPARHAEGALARTHRSARSTMTPPSEVATRGPNPPYAIKQARRMRTRVACGDVSCQADVVNIGPYNTLPGGAASMLIPTPVDHLAHRPTSTPMIAGAATGSHDIFLRGSLLLTDQRLAGFGWRACAFAVAPHGLMLSAGSTTGRGLLTPHHRT